MVGRHRPFRRKLFWISNNLEFERPFLLKKTIAERQVSKQLDDFELIAGLHDELAVELGIANLDILRAEQLAQRPRTFLVEDAECEGIRRLEGKHYRRPGN